MTYRSPKGNEKQIDYIIVKRKHMKFNKDAEANDMIQMGSDHRCVMATFTITTPKKDGRCKKKKKTKLTKMKQTLGMRSLSSKKYQEIIEKMKENAGAANKESNQSKGKPPKQKQLQHKQKARKQKRKQKNRRIIHRNRGEERRGDGRRSRANEEAGSIVLHVGHVKHMTSVISNDETCHEGEATMEHKREGTNKNRPKT